MYHINHEGKIYPCRAKILRCPYGTDMHAETREELYYKLMSTEREVEVPDSIYVEASRLGRIKSLNAISLELETSKHPIETIVSSLEHGIKIQKDRANMERIKENLKIIENMGANDTYDLLKYGLEIPNYIPGNIVKQGYVKFKNMLDSKTMLVKGEDPLKNKDAIRIINRIEDNKHQYELYNNTQKYKLTEENYDSNMEWLQMDFEKYSRDLNFSKIITKPIFYKDSVKEAGKKIKNFTDYELLSAYDDYMLTNRERREEREHFKFEYRDDISEKANENIKEWYYRNQTIYSFWNDNNPRLILISMKMAEELDNRGILRQDNLLGRK